MTTKSLSKHEMALLASNQFDALRAAGWTPSELIAAGFTPSDLRAAAFTPSDLRAALEEVPMLDKPYSRLLADIKDKKRKFNQSTFGPDSAPAKNVCGTPMCTAGHLVNMAGAAGWKLKKQFGFAGAARLIHEKAHPDWPPQNFGNIPDALARAYIEEMAEREAQEAGDGDNAR